MTNYILVGCLALLSALGVSAQTSTPTAPPGAPAATSAPVAPMSSPASSPGGYRSAFEGYRSYTDDKPVPWKEANDTVGRIGGWRAYAREAQEPAVQGGAAPAAAGATDPHAGHRKP